MGIFIEISERSHSVPLSLAFDRPVVVLNLETTGVNVQTDRIIELALIKFDPSGPFTSIDRRLHPGIPIPLLATKVHGITDVAKAPRFATIVDEVDEFLGNNHLVGFG
jgi:DNA polymerase III subunit epsilon